MVEEHGETLGLLITGERLSLLQRQLKLYKSNNVFTHSRARVGKLWPVSQLQPICLFS